MQVNALDHVNIVTDDVPATARFYADLLGLDPRSPPGMDDPTFACWIYDAGERPILHVVSSKAETPTGYGKAGSGPTGAIDHVALNCSGYDEIEARLKDRGMDYKANEVPQISLRQLFTLDPNGVLLELNFFADD